MPRWRNMAATCCALLAMGSGGCRDARPPVDRTNPSTTQTSLASPESSTLASTAIRFEEAAAERGLQFTYRNDEEQGRFAIIESMGGGVGLLDFDRDGRLDIWLPGGGRYSGPRQLSGHPHGVFRALDDGRQFVNVAPLANAGASSQYSDGVAVGDVDQDGFPDVLVTGYGGLQFFRNLGDGTFRESAAAAGLDDRLWSVSAAWGDLNGDQWLDLYVTHYVNWSFDNDPVCTARPPEPRDVCPPRRFEALPDAVYFGNSDGTFREASEEAGLRRDGKGLGVILVDLDADGDLDIYVANDTEGNFLYRNDGGRFADQSVASGTSFNERGLPDGSMGVAMIDGDGDGRPDLFVTNYEGEDAALYQNLGELTFRHVSRLQGISAVGPMYVGWGMAVLDADLDGDDDLIVSNGHAIRFPGESGLAQRPLCFEHRGTRFVNVAPAIGGFFAERHRGRGLAAGDLDRDGRVDLVMSSVNEPAALLLNRTPAIGAALRVELVGRESHRDAIGAIVELKMGSQKQVRQVIGGGSYASAAERALYFSRPNPSPTCQIQIRWPSGRMQEVSVDPSVRELTVIESTTAVP